jgi:GMP synthase-like glutamine amidotransferase
MRIHVFEHDRTETLGSIEAWAELRGHSITRTPWHEGGAVPDAQAWDLLVVMGGPMNIYEEDAYPWLAQEKVFLDEAIAQGKWMLGVCLGAQLLADRLGGLVTKGAHTEIGWHEVWRLPEAQSDPLFSVLPESFLSMHWHGDTFAIPPGAVHGFTSQACRSQAFRKGSVVGLQCHLEFTPAALEGLVAAQGRYEGEYVQSPAQFLAREADFAKLRKHLFTFLDALEREVSGQLKTSL